MYIMILLTPFLEKSINIIPTFIFKKTTLKWKQVKLVFCLGFYQQLRSTLIYNFNVKPIEFWAQNPTCTPTNFTSINTIRWKNLQNRQCDLSSFIVMHYIALQQGVIIVQHCTIIEFTQLILESFVRGSFSFSLVSFWLFFHFLCIFYYLFLWTL
jgi:hypothetical protein